MTQLEVKSVCILGRLPGLGLAELESIYGAEHVHRAGRTALLDIPAEEINFKNLGGTIKTGRRLAVVETTAWRDLADYLIKTIPAYVLALPAGKFTLGVSVYGLKVPLNQLQAALLEIKKRVKVSGRPIRIVPNKAEALNSAQVLHNKLTTKGAWELLLIKDGSRMLVAQTLFVQDIAAYAARDQARPARDMRVGMLPPKLAQIIINLAAGRLTPDPDDRLRIRILDPFCGTGVILQESLLMGFSSLGSDIDKRMVDYSRKNIHWLFDKYPKLEGNVEIQIGDATSCQWPPFYAVASELFLGRPLTKLPEPDELKQLVNSVDTIAQKFLINLAKQLRKGQTLCLAVPVWLLPGGRLLELPLLAKLTEMGYNYFNYNHTGRDELVYYRQHQIVGRRLLKLIKA